MICPLIPEPRICISTHFCDQRIMSFYLFWWFRTPPDFQKHQVFLGKQWFLWKGDFHGNRKWNHSVRTVLEIVKSHFSKMKTFEKSLFGHPWTPLFSGKVHFPLLLEWFLEVGRRHDFQKNAFWHTFLDAKVCQNDFSAPPGTQNLHFDILLHLKKCVKMHSPENHAADWPPETLLGVTEHSQF